MKIDMSPHDTLQLMMDFIREVRLDESIPDGGDLVDFFGEILSESNWPGMLEEIPGLQSCTNLVSENCEGNITLGLFNRDGSLRLNFKTDGLKSFYELIMRGMY